MEPYTESFAGDLLLADQSNLYTMWVALRKMNLPVQIPSWTGFNIKLRENKQINQSNIGYLDCLDAPATDMSTIYHMMQRSVKIKEQLKLRSIVCVYDQAIYAKAYQIKCKNPDQFKGVFLMMGTFHVILNFLAVIAARFKDAGLRDIIVQSMIVAEGSVDTMFNGSRAYNRAARSYKILYEAFSRILLDDFELVFPLESNKLQQTLQNVDDDFVSSFGTHLSRQELHSYCTNLITFKESMAKQSELARFWFSFLDIVVILLNIIYATRSGDWDLYVESLRTSLPWFFAYDRTNYSRYLTTHLNELLALESTHPDVYNEFQKGNFSVQISESNTFGRMEADKVIETTINRDTKTSGGTTGNNNFQLHS